ncbi:alkyl/aryl-sulfatase [Marinomonas algicola]|uniref:alkyl/aryl-sulfatase n=1 Tax=Marinomonas algicola TaxID=2773454 RepID=UPI00174DECA6|nr:alkyl/aryl-sulfatase [Marinomonas algicola]
MQPLDKLKQHSERFQKSIQEPSQGIWIAIGYAASNVSIVSTSAGLVIIDTTESTTAADNILRDLRKITQDKVVAIIYTHGHRDHVGGASVFAAEGFEHEKVKIYARANLSNEMAEGGSTSNPDVIFRKRAARQFGIPLQAGSERINLGIGPADRPIEGLGKGFLTPTDTFSDDALRLNIGDRIFDLIAAPGETNDQMMVWMPTENIVFAADNFYHSFPNLYAIRGTSYRDFEVWADTLDNIQSMGAELMLTGHGQPVAGKEAISQCLGDYSAAIRFIIEKSVEGMNKGMTPDELVAFVTLPEPLRSRPYLAEFYGTVEWSVRAFFAGKIGWFDGNPTHLFPFTPQEYSNRFIALVGDEKLCTELETAMTKGDYQWALHLTDWLLQHSDSIKVKQTRIKALRQIADLQMNAPARNYYLTCALELQNSL